MNVLFLHLPFLVPEALVRQVALWLCLPLFELDDSSSSPPDLLLEALFISIRQLIFTLN